MTVDHTVHSGDGRADGIAEFVITFATYLSGTGEAVSRRRAASQAHRYQTGVDSEHRSAPSC